MRCCTVRMRRQDPSDVVFTVTNVTGGTLYLGTTPLNSSDTFTQADVDNGLVSFLDDGGRHR